MVGYSMDGAARDRVMRLMTEKDRIEREIGEQTAVLESNNVGMTDPLVDADGFPRADIDVYKVRHARHRIICLQNDHKALMKRIEQGLADVHSDFVGPSGEGPSAVSSPSASPYANGHAGNGHSNGHSSGQSSGPSSGLSNNVARMNLNEHGFAFVGPVQNGSPADQAGLRENDELLQFGTINIRNFTDLPQIHTLVSNSVGANISVTLKRDQRIIQLTVVPRPWTQPGLLGCHIRRRAD